jgi:hypothetical protein
MPSDLPSFGWRDRGNNPGTVPPSFLEYRCTGWRDIRSEVADAKADHPPALGVAAANRAACQVTLRSIIAKRAVDGGEEILDVQVVR